MQIFLSLSQRASSGVYTNPIYQLFLFFFLGTRSYLMRNEMETFFPISSDIYYLHNKKSLIEPLKTNVLQILKKSQDIGGNIAHRLRPGVSTYTPTAIRGNFRINAADPRIFFIITISLSRQKVFHYTHGEFIYLITSFLLRVFE